MTEPTGIVGNSPSNETAPPTKRNGPVLEIVGKRMKVSSPKLEPTQSKYCSKLRITALDDQGQEITGDYVINPAFKLEIQVHCEDDTEIGSIHHQGFGNITVQGLCNVQQVYTSNGTISIKDTVKVDHVSCAGGNVYIDGVIDKPTVE